MTTAEYFTAVERHDWFYQFSDDHRVYVAGNADYERLVKEATDDTKKRILNDWSAYHYSGPPFGKSKAPKPILSSYVTVNS